MDNNKPLGINLGAFLCSVTVCQIFAVCRFFRSER